MLRLRLPASLDSLKPTIVIMEWIPNLCMKTLDEPLERDIMESLISELNSKFNSGLDPNFSTSRDSPDALEDGPPLEAKDDIIAIGSSHLTRTVLSMKKFGDTINCMASPSWRLTEDNVKSSALALEDAVKANPGATIIYQLFDSFIFFSSSAPGELALPKRGEDGCFHVAGDLVLADWSAFRKIFYVSIPLLRAGGNNRKILLSPLPRYSTAKCCQNEEHITNFGKKGFGTSMGSKLAEIHSWIDDFARGKHIKNCEVICPASTIMTGDDISKKDLAAFWGSDPVHLTPMGYEKLGEQLSEKIESIKQKKRLREDSQADQPNQRPRLNSGSRVPGLSKSDSFANRWEKSGGHGSHSSSPRDSRFRTGGQLGQPGQRKK